MGFVAQGHVEGTVHVAADSVEYMAEVLVLSPADDIDLDGPPRLANVPDGCSIPILEVNSVKFNAFVAGHREVLNSPPHEKAKTVCQKAKSGGRGHRAAGCRRHGH